MNKRKRKKALKCNQCQRIDHTKSIDDIIPEEKIDVDLSWFNDILFEVYGISPVEEPFSNYGLAGGSAEEVIINDDGTKTVIKR